MTLGDRVIINAAITGCVVSQDDAPDLPVARREIVDCVRRVRDAGASIAHIHLRDAGALYSIDKQAYIDCFAAIRVACPGIILCASLSGRHIADPLSRAIPLSASPDMASLTLGSVNFMNAASISAPDTITQLSKLIYAAGARPELEVFEPGFASYARYLVKKDVLVLPLYANVLLGNRGSSPLDAVGAGHIVSQLPEGCIWAFGGIGRYQLDANVLALSLGGHVRTGLEDNIYADRERTVVTDNVRLVERIALIADMMGRPCASPAEVRKALKLRPE